MCQDMHRILNKINLNATAWATINVTNVGTGGADVIPTTIADAAVLRVEMTHNTNGNTLYLTGDPGPAVGVGGQIAGYVDANTQKQINTIFCPLNDNIIRYRGLSAVLTGPTVNIYVVGYPLSL